MTFTFKTLFFNSIFHVYFIFNFLRFNQHVSACGHQPVSPDELGRVFMESTHSNRKKRDVSKPFENMRIHVTYDDSLDDLSPERQSLIKNSVMKEAVSYWEGALKTRRLSEPLKLARSCKDSVTLYRTSNSVNDRQYYCYHGCNPVTKCGDMIIPENHLKGCRYSNASLGPLTLVEEPDGDAGVPDADFLLYVAAKETSRCETSVAYATFCQLEVEFDRPIAGFVNFCPKELSTHSSQLENVIATVKHEMLHALGFSLSLFGLYRDAEGNPLTERTPEGNYPARGPDHQFVYSDKVVKTITRSNWKTIEGYKNWTVTMVVTPRVTAEVRNHFNCSTLEGAELENQGSSGTQLTHWEKRVFENELMTGIYTQNPIISRVTLALMEDTGWYQADYSYASPLEWGANLGCDFTNSSCYDWIVSKQQRNESPHPYCTEDKSVPLKTSCTTMRMSMALCNLHEHNAVIPIDYRISAERPNVGGIVELADYCPYLQEFSWKQDNKYVRGSDCLFPSNQPTADSDFALEHYGADSRCFEQTVPFEMSQCNNKYISNNYGSGCYRYKCSENEGLTIYVRDEPYRCYKEGQILDIHVYTDVSYHYGTIVCPSCQEICQNVINKCPAESEPPISSPPVVRDVPCIAAHITLNNSILILICSVIITLTFT